MAEGTNSVLMDPPAMTEEQEKLVSVIAGMENDGIPEEVIKQTIPKLEKQIKKDKEDDIFFGALLPEVDVKEPKDTKLSEEDLTKKEEPVVVKGRKYYDGLDIEFDKAVLGAEVIQVDDKRYKVGTGSSVRKPRPVVLDELKIIANNAKEVKKTNLNGLFDGDLYDEAFDYAYIQAFRMPEDLSGEEMLNHRDETFDHAMDIFHNSPKGKQVLEEISIQVNEKFESFMVEIVDDIIQGNISDEDAFDVISVTYDEIKNNALENNEQYQTIINTNRAAVGSVYNRDIAGKMKVENVDQIYPWYAKSDFIGGAWEQLALHVPKASKIIGRMYLSKDYRAITGYKNALIEGTELPSLSGFNVNVPQTKGDKIYFPGTFRLSENKEDKILSLKGGYYDKEALLDRLNLMEQRYHAKILENIIDTQEIQDILNKINSPKAYHSLDGWQREMGKQTMNLMGSIFTSILYPFALEGAGAYEEMINIEGERRYSDWNKPSWANAYPEVDGKVSEYTNKQLAMISIIEDGSVIEKIEDTATGVGFVNAGLEVATDGFIIFKASGVRLMPSQLYNEMKKGLYKNTIKATGDIGKTMLQTGAIEVPTEFIQETVTTAGVSTGAKYPNAWDGYWRKQKEIALTTALTSPFLGGGGAIVFSQTRNAIDAIFDMANPDAMTNSINLEIEKLQSKIGEITDEDYNKQLDVLNKTNDLLRSEEYGGLAWTKDTDAKLVIKEKIQELAQLDINFKTVRTKLKDIKEKYGEDYKESQDYGVYKSDLDNLIKKEQEVNLDIIKAKVKAWKNKTYKEVATRHNEDLNSDRKYKVFNSNKELLAYLKKEHNLDGRSKEARAIKSGEPNGIYYGLQLDGKKLIVVSLENVNNNIDKEDASLLAGNVDIHEDMHATMDGLSDSDKLNLINKVQDLLLNDAGLINLKIQQALLNRAYATLTPGIDFKVVGGKYVPLSKRGLEEYMPYLSDAMFEYRVQDFSKEGVDGLDNMKKAFEDILKADLTESDILNFIREINRGGVRTGYEKTAVDWFLDKEGNPLVYHYMDIDIVGEKATLMSQSPGETASEMRKGMGFGKDVSGKNKEIQDLMIANINNPRKIKSLQGEFIINNAGAIQFNERKWQADKGFVVSKDIWETEVFAIASDLARTYKPLLTEIEFDAIVEKNKQEEKPIPRKVIAKDIDGEANIINPVNFGAYFQGLMPLRINKIIIDATKELELRKKIEQENEDLYSGTSVDEVLDREEAIKNNQQTSKLREFLGIEQGSYLYDQITFTAAETINKNIDKIDNSAKFENAITKDFKGDWRLLREALFPEEFKNGKRIKPVDTEKYKSTVTNGIRLIYEVMPVAEVTKLRLGLTEAVVLDPTTGRVRQRVQEAKMNTDVNISDLEAGNVKRRKIKLTPELEAQLIDTFLNPQDGRLDMAQERFLRYLSNLLLRDASITGLKSTAFIDKYGDIESLIGQVAQVLKQNSDFLFSSSKGVKTTIYANTPNFEQRLKNVIENVRTFDIQDEEGINDYLDNLDEEFAIKELARKAYSIGYILSLDSVEFKKEVVALGDQDLNNIIVPSKKKGGQGRLRYNETSLESLQEAGLELAKVLGPEVFEVLKGFDILGYHYGALDAAVNKKETINGKEVNAVDSNGDEIRGKYYEKLQELKEAIKDIKPTLPEGLILSDVELINPQSKLATELKAITRLETKAEKLEALEKLAPKIRKANIANIKLIEFIADKLKEVYQNNPKVTKLDVYNLLQAQTSIKNGFRSLSKLEYLTLKEGSYIFNKGEHIDPNSLTMLNMYKYIVGETDVLDLENHSQWFTQKSITDVMDTDPTTGKMTLRTNPAGELRFNLISQAEQDNVVDINGRPLDDIIIEKQIIKAIKQSETINEANKPKSQPLFSLSPRFNEILEETEGVGREKIFSDAQGKMRGAAVDKYKILPIMPSGQDFKGLLYSFLAKGTQGEQQMKWFEDNLINPYVEGTNKINEARQDIGSNYKELIKKLPKIKTKLTDLVPGTNYTYGQAVRVYLWDFYGFEIPGISKRDQKLLVKTVKDSSDLTTFAMGLSKITQLDAGYVEPTEYWTAEGIGSDLYSLTSRVGRAKFLKDFIEAREQIFGEFDSRGRLYGPNIAKIEAIYGNKFKEALEDILYRMEFGRKRNVGDNRITNNWDNWINASVGSIMFFNMRSAVLQLISATNYVDTENNNVFAAATAFANQPNYWRTVAKLWNSPFLQQRLSGESRTINEAELASFVQGKENKVKAAISYLLKIGFTPTRLADATAITFGGATYFINQKKSYIADGLSEQQAEENAMRDWIAKSQESQQSSDAMMISQQQAGSLGRIILAFKNTPMQYARLIDKAVRDIKNGRGSTRANLSKIAYYGFVQNLIFNMLQNAIWKAEADDEKIDEKTARTINGMLDSLIGGLGLGGNVVVTFKNGVLEYIKQDQRGWNSDHTYTILRLANLSPTIGSKLRKIYSSIQTEKFNEEAIKEMSYFNPGNPAFDVMANLVSGLTNIPLDRAVNKVQNLIIAADSETEFWDSFALTLGWNTWDLGIEDEAKKVKKELKEKEKAAKKQCTAIKSKGGRCKNKTTNKSGKCYVHDK